MIRLLLLAALLPVAARAQLAFSLIDGSTETPLVSGSSYTLRSVEVGEELSVRLRVRNNGVAAVDITTFFVDGPGFVLERPLPPYRLQVNENLNGTLRFTGTEAKTYSATALMNNVSVTLNVSVVLGAKLTFAAPCTTNSSGAIDFGIPYIAQAVSCPFTLRNENALPVQISKVIVAGTGYTVQNLPDLTSPLGVGATISFTVQLIPQAHSTISGTLTVNARNYALTAIGVDPPILQPIVDFESSAYASGQQRRVTMQLPSPSLFSSSGLMTITFEPSYTLAADDPAIVFLETNSRQIPFTLQQGQTAVKLNNSTFVTLQTGTTAGKITVTLSGLPGGISGNTFVLTIPPSTIAVDKTIATRFLDRIELVLTGFDNTFSAGSMLFRFYDANGQQITAAIPADFTLNFRKFYVDTPGGSTFKVTLKFPLSNGDVTKLASMDAEFANTAGTVRTSKLTF